MINMQWKAKWDKSDTKFSKSSIKRLLKELNNPYNFDLDMYILSANDVAKLRYMLTNLLFTLENK